ncbi:hypothetical protein [Fibrisoma limi]|uniref:hypothetical protein n=1 Tax=Fibrisoma limi TaxID=663275 RepID=UPI0005875CBD|nr:hypothetical protein [Fibrisoma limi]
MIHQGKKLREIANAKGYDIQRLADKLDVHRVTVETDFKKEKLTRRILVKYVPVLGIDLEEFFTTESKAERRTVNLNDSVVSQAEVIEIQKQLIEEQRKRLALMEYMVSFFPKAVQMR